MENSLRRCLVGCALLLLLAGAAQSAPVSEAEAVAIAEWWYASEVIAPTTTLSRSEKEHRLLEKDRHDVHYVLGRDNLQRSRKAGDEVLAYVVAFEPGGFVVVSGEDTVQPVLAFNTKGSFTWESPERSYLSHFVGRSVVAAAQHARAMPQKGLASLVHTNWPRLRQLMKTAPSPGVQTQEPGTTPAPMDAGICVVLPTAEWGQGDHYNELCASHCGANNVPTGCTATAMAIKFRYHQWPLRGNGSHSYRDAVGAITYTHSVDFSQETYDWAAMPNDSLTADNAEVAKLMYDCGVSVNMDYAMGGSGAWTSASAMNTYFRYRGTIDNASSTPLDHLAAMAYSIQAGLPVVMSSSAHTVVACGYRDTIAPYFYLNTGWDGSQCAWYDLNQVPGGDATIDRSYPYSSPDNYVYVNAAYSYPAFQNGNLQSPYITLADGLSRVQSGGSMLLKGDQNHPAASFPLTLSQPMTLRSYLGAATIR